MFTAEDKTFFETFGYLVLPGALKDDIGWIIDDFEAAWTARTDIVHDGSKRTMFPTNMISTSPRLTALLEHPVISETLDALIGDDWSFNGGDGNFYSGDTGWHHDHIVELAREQSLVRHVKVAFYLDPLKRDTGALRVIPGSHHHGDHYAAAIKNGLAGRDGRDIPSVAIESTPGDLVFFDHRLWHASYGGSNRRRMFTMNTYAGYHNEAERQAILALFRWYRDTLKVNWMAGPMWHDWYLGMSPGQRRRMHKTFELGAIVQGETMSAAS
jgi:hypothetical protein